MNIEYNGSEVQEWIRQLAGRFGKEVAIDCQKCVADVSDAFGDGTITGYAFPMGLRMLLLSVNMKEELEMRQASGHAHPVYLHFSVTGYFTHRLKGGEEEYQLDQFSSSVSANPHGSAQAQHFNEGKDIRHVIILIDRAAYQPRLDCDQGKMNEELKNLLQDTDAEKFFLFRNAFTLAVSESVNALFENKREGHANSAFVEGKALQLIGIQLGLYKNGGSGKGSSFKEKDLQALRNAHEILLSDLQDPPTIPQLARKVGINQQKLKTGFKELYGLPVNQYLRNLRLEKARALLLESDKDIQEVSTHVGYSNASYFARRFKDRYGMLPKNARK